MSTTTSRRVGSRLFWRIYSHGIGLLVLTSIALLTIGHFVRPIDSHPRHRRNILLLADRTDLLAAQTPLDPHRLRALLEDLPVDATIYDAQDNVLASNTNPPLPFDAERRATLERHSGFQMPQERGHTGAMLLERSNTVLVWKPPWSQDEDRWRRIVTIVLIMLALLTVVSLPLARRIAMPIDKLVEAAQRLGAGDLRSRTGITRRDDLGELARTFDEMADRLEKLLRSEKELLANVSHELRTPLARMRVALELAAEGDSDAARRYIGEVSTDINELERLIDDVLTAARFDLADGRDGSLPPLRRGNVPSATLLQEAAARFASSHPGRRLEVSVAEGTPELVADRVLLRRAIDNLLDNAAKYSEPNTSIELALTTEAGKAVFTVRDHGVGISPADMEHLFTPFFRSDPSRSRATGGFGLGLALARRIVQAHGGTLDATSTPGVGSSFVVRVPAAG